MARLEKLAFCLVTAAFLTPGVCLAQAPAGETAAPSNVWTFSTDSSITGFPLDFTMLASETVPSRAILIWSTHENLWPSL